MRAFVLVWAFLCLTLLIPFLIAFFLIRRSTNASEIRVRVEGERREDLERQLSMERAEIKLRDDLLNVISEGVILARDDGEVTYANEPARNFFVGNTLTALPAQLRQTGHNFVIHHPERRELEFVSFELPEGKTIYVIQDVTETRRVDAIRRDFVSNASHELKTPVAAIQASAETLADAVTDDPEAAKNFTRTLAAEAKRLSRLVQDLLDLARLEKGEEQKINVSFGALVEKMTSEITDRVRERGLKLTTDINEGLAVPGIESDLALMVRNLLDNAVAYTLEGGISITLTDSEHEVVLTVSDTGVGIPGADLNRIFERFYRVDKGRSRETGGTGLGLAIVRHVAETHGGRVNVNSEVGAGSTFIVTLPNAQDTHD